MTKKATARRILYQIIVFCFAIPARGAEPSLASILEGLRGEHLSGHVSREARNLVFEQWCKDRKADPGEVARLQYAEYPRDVDLLGRTRDPRAAALLLEGLGSVNPCVVAKAAQGLGLLGRTDAVPLLAKACERFTNDGSAIAARAFAEFQTPLAEQYLKHFETDWRLLLRYHKDAAQRRDEYAKKAAARRNGGQ